MNLILQGLLKTVEIAWADQGTTTVEERRKHKKAIDVPFNSTNKYQVRLFKL